MWSCNGKLALERAGACAGRAWRRRVRRLRAACTLVLPWCRTLVLLGVAWGLSIGVAWCCLVLPPPYTPRPSHTPRPSRRESVPRAAPTDRAIAIGESRSRDREGRSRRASPRPSAAAARPPMSTHRRRAAARRARAGVRPLLVLLPRAVVPRERRRLAPRDRRYVSVFLLRCHPFFSSSSRCRNASRATSSSGAARSP